MRTLKLYTLIFTLVFFASYNVKSQANFSIKFIKASIEGTSTLHDWQSEITQINYKGIIQSGSDASRIIRDVEIKIPVEGIKSKEGKIMDHKTYEAFESDKNPFIIYSFNNTQVIVDAAHNVSFHASGNLSMAGTSKPVSIVGSGRVLPNGDLQFLVSEKIKMSAFNMIPPTAILGTITVGDEVTVNFEMILTPSKI